MDLLSPDPVKQKPTFSQKYIKLSESDKQFFRNFFDVPHVNPFVAFLCLILNTCLIFIIGVGTIVASFCTRTGYVKKTQIIIGLMQMSIGNPYTLGYFEIGEGSDGAHVADLEPQALYWIALGWATIWSLLIIKKSCKKTTEPEIFNGRTIDGIRVSKVK